MERLVRELLFERLALGDVPKVQHDASDGPLLDELRRNDLDEDRAAAVEQHPQLGRAGPLGPQYREREMAIAGRHELLEPSALQPVRSIAEHPLRGRARPRN